MSSNIKIILNTNVLYSGLYSSNGASFKILQSISEDKLKPVLLTPLLFEYEEILNRNQAVLRLSIKEIEKILNYFCLISEHQKIYFLWRPYLPDSKDDLLLELAVASGTKFIITHNIRDFKGSEKFNVKAITPKNFLEKIKWAH